MGVDNGSTRVSFTALHAFNPKSKAMIQPGDELFKVFLLARREDACPEVARPSFRKNLGLVGSCWIWSWSLGFRFVVPGFRIWCGVNPRKEDTPGSSRGVRGSWGTLLWGPYNKDPTI